MARMGRLLAVLTLGGVLLLSPAAGGTAVAATEQAPVAATALVAQEPTAPPGPDLNGDQQSAFDDKQRLAVGIGGFVLIAAVLFSRKARKRPILSFKWKR
ncbi:hypothetical protein GCM10027271_02720 [Saccharopolyspora gloriosae]|uniref:MYXO-CTERM domain-containing protein n=1 Tax=Saccharopolyspora gloriosae TaxID=455344 RepID=A0A840NP35_9PSEU|nr:hypothetical protein [Saccharopolyspora gloriosae]MBB5071823.1 hypothetical protein [Saccharopolyspora gloriosae]